MKEKILHAGATPSQRELSALEFDANGFAHYLQYVGLYAPKDDSILAHVVARTRTPMGNACIKHAGSVEIKSASPNNHGVNVYITSGEFQKVLANNVSDAYELIKTHWALNNY